MFLKEYRNIKNVIDFFKEEKYAQTDLRGIEEKISSLGYGDILGGYRNTLKEIANERKYQLGEKLLNSDLKRINRDFGAVLFEFNTRISQLPNRTLEEKNNLLFVVADYLFAIALDELGCPDIPIFFGDEGKKNFADFMKSTSLLSNSEDYQEVSTDTQFKEQRGKSADYVRTATEDYFNRKSFNPLKPLEGAKFVAEYQALKKRQDNHWRIWKWFHGKENDKRMALLAEMKAELEKHIDTESMDIDTIEPKDVAEYMDGKNVDKMLEKEFDKDGFAKRNSFGSKVFEHVPTSTKRYDEEIKGMEKTSIVNIKDDVDLTNQKAEIKDKIDEKQNQKDNSQILK